MNDNEDETGGASHSKKSKVGISDPFTVRDSSVILQDFFIILQDFLK